MGVVSVWVWSVYGCGQSVTVNKQGSNYTCRNEHVFSVVCIHFVCVHGVKFSLTYWPQVEMHDCTQNFKSKQLSMYNHRYFRLCKSKMPDVEV